ncbi:MAG: alpha-amylase family glycosyl hydrolase [Ignavibacteria bacterium]|nr:alpha-amylase family glycosyl hydrolase [Ignavibacteria bacterium]
MKSVKFFLIFLLIELLFNSSKIFSQTPQGDTYLQGFYWNVFPGGVWWDSLSKLATKIKSAGFSSIYIPPPSKGAGGGFSMGYDIYDHYDFGEFYQKGSVETRFGSKSELQQMIKTFKTLGIDVYVDVVLNHTAGGELRSKNNCRTDSAWLIFNYPFGSKRFPKNANSFNPSENNNCNQSPPYNDNFFSFANDNCTDCPDVRDSLIVWGKYLRNYFGFNGARLDAVKHINPNFISQFVNQSFPSNYIVAEYIGSGTEIKNYYNQLASMGAGRVSFFDFPLRYTLADMCNNSSGTFDMRRLDNAGLIFGQGMSGFNVSTFVENHDFDRTGWDGTIDTAVGGHSPIFRDKHLGYAFILFSEGRPSVFFKDYFDYRLSPIIDTLIFIRHKFLGGTTTLRNGLDPWYIRQDGNQDQNLLAQDIYVARRNGWQNQIGGYLVINDNPNQWIDVWVDTDLPVGTVYKEYTGKDVNKTVVGPRPGGTKNRVKLWAPPRNFTIYIADTTHQINHSPVIQKLDTLNSFTLSEFKYQILASDANNDPLNFTIQNKPHWISFNSTGLLKGTPQISDTGIYSNIIVSVSDNRGGIDTDTFTIKVYLNRFPTIVDFSDTTIFTTKRFERQIIAYDIDADTLYYSFIQKPSWLGLDTSTGVMAGIPAPEDTGKFLVIFRVYDSKGGADTSSFNLTVREKKDTLIFTYAKPRIDGIILIGANDWRPEWLIVDDPIGDSKWTLVNEFDDLFFTWDADSIYFGAKYTLVNNTLQIFVDVGIDGGETNFNAFSGYLGAFPRNFRFRSSDNIDLMIAAWNRERPRVFKIRDSNSIEITSLCTRAGSTQAEVAIAWNTIFGLGPGLVPPYTSFKIVSVISGGDNWGAGDAAPSNCDVELCPPGNDTLYQGPDSLITLYSIQIDKNGDGIPDPTVVISSITEEKFGNNLNPKEFYVSNLYPNPFNSFTRLDVLLRNDNNLEIKLFDLLGREIKSIVNQSLRRGNHSFTIDASNLSSGIYFIQIKTNKTIELKKLILIK